MPVKSNFIARFPKKLKPYDITNMDRQIKFYSMFREYFFHHTMSRLDTVSLPSSLEANQVLVKMLAAPINPADINMIEGSYAILPQMPAVVGNEGVGVVEAVGSNVRNVKVGQRVVPAQPAFGTFRTYAVCGEKDVQAVSSDIPLEYAATLAVNPATAYRMLHDFTTLKSGDVIVQNGANSMVGHAVIQLAKLRGIKTINIIRDRPHVEKVVEKLKTLGADIVVTEQYAGTAAMKRLLSDVPKAKLALNCVGGNAARVAASFLDRKGVMVTYGGMARQPVTLPTSSFIFNDISLRGFWLSKWVQEHGAQERQAMLDELTGLIKNNQLVFFLHTFKFNDYKRAFDAALDPLPAERRKIVLKME
jgi:trans-2-enoyl-CoA reductase